MRSLQMFQVDAFTQHLFQGNPAAVVPLETWLEDHIMQAIAAENNLAETAFFVPQGDSYHLRWFTPACEVDLCGHATLASAYVLYEHFQYAGPAIRFQSRAGLLTVTRNAADFTLDFPVDPVRAGTVTPELCAGLGAEPLELWHGMYDLAVFANQAQVIDLRPDFRSLARHPGLAVVCTAAGDEVDFVSRFFGPSVGVDEDPVTGSAHCMLTHYWAKRLGKTTLRARQVSPRGGNLNCQLKGERVLLTGQARLYLQGTFFLD